MPGKTCDADRLESGDHLYEVTGYTVEKVNNDDTVDVKDLNGNRLTIGRSVVESAIFSTKQHTSEKKVTKTQLAQKMETLGRASFRVTFQKQVSSNDVADGLENAFDENEFDVASKAKRRKVVKQLMEGTQRVMHAKLLMSDEFDVAMELGRFRVIDLEELADHGDEARAQRLVDTRTVSELVVDNVRYFT